VYVDFQEEYQTAAVEFAKEAAGPSNVDTISLRHFRGDISTPSSSESVGSDSRDSSPSADDINSTPPSSAASSDDLPEIIIPPGTKRYLLLCVNSGMDLIDLAHVDLTHTMHDEVLFQQIRAEYAKIRGNKIKNIFVIPKKIEYIKVYIRIHIH
jgi:hypothetical protein